jgi:hypothetical protein
MSTGGEHGDEGAGDDPLVAAAMRGAGLKTN